MVYWDAVHSRGLGQSPVWDPEGEGRGQDLEKPEAGPPGGRRYPGGGGGGGARLGRPRQTSSAGPTSPPGVLPNLAFYGEEVGPSGLGCRRGGVGAAGAGGELWPGAAHAGLELEVASLSLRWAM